MRRYALLLPLLTLAATAHAQQVATTGTVDAVNQVTAIGATTWYGEQFRVGATGFQVGSVELLLNVSNGANATVYFYTNSTPPALGTPGTRIGNGIASGAQTAATAQWVTFSNAANNDITLTANTLYWLVASAPTGTVNWNYAAPASNTGTNGTANDRYARSNNGGSTFSTNAGAQGFDGQLFRINAVPEPSAYVTLGISLFLVGGLVARRRFCR